MIKDAIRYQWYLVDMNIVIEIYQLSSVLTHDTIATEANGWSGSRKTPLNLLKL